MEQELDSVMLSFANGLIKASLATCRSNYVPQADVTIGETAKAFLIAHGLEVLAYRAAEQPPELICGVRIIACSSKRSVTGKAAEQNQPDV